MTNQTFPIEHCPNCGQIGEYVSLVDGVVKTIACKCGYTAPGMAVAGTQTPPGKTHEINWITAEQDSLRARAERAEQTLREVEAIMDGFENETPGKINYHTLIYRIRDRIALSRGE